MKTAAAIFATAALAIISTSPADAKGCLKGAAVGGVAGHYADITGSSAPSPAAPMAATTPTNRIVSDNGRPEGPPGRRSCRSVIPGCAKRRPGIHNHDNVYGFRTAVRGFRNDDGNSLRHSLRNNLLAIRVVFLRAQRRYA